MSITLDGLAGLQAQVGQDLGHSDWLLVDQARIDAFANATGDHQWIHVDPERAAAESPFGKTIAHGFLTLSLIPVLQRDIYQVTGIKMGINYGTDKVRYPTPVPVDSRVRLGATLNTIEQLPDDSAQIRWGFTVELDGAARPACVAEMLVRYVF